MDIVEYCQPINIEFVGADSRIYNHIYEQHPNNALSLDEHRPVMVCEDYLNNLLDGFHSYGTPLQSIFSTIPIFHCCVNVFTVLNI
ncbi:hypothetical protein THRCLA_21100 [Thraustotheca clavata]|uniref:Uncharacterized protein n=1 Tax=Thraustotheca clavata TaxID=74557 RepID=A0A1W0A0H5_9STRA|nr:hypothetical protein THRCLA_21100 [Thraustotheca clavata]